MQTGEGVWYPAGAPAPLPRRLIRLAGDLGVEFVIGALASNRIATDAGRPRVGRRSRRRPARSRSPRSSRTATRSAPIASCSPAAPRPSRFERRRGYEPACSGVVLYLGLDRRYEQLLHHNFVFSRDPHEEFDAIYRRGEPAPDPTCYLCAPAVTEPERRADGGRGAVRPGPHALPPPRPRLGRALSGLPPRRSSTSSRSTAGMEDLESRYQNRATTDAAGYPRAIPRTRRRDLRPGEPRPVQRRVQAGESQPGRPGALPRRGRGPPGARHADGVDVGLDRRPTHSIKTVSSNAETRRRRRCRRLNASSRLMSARAVAEVGADRDALPSARTASSAASANMHDGISARTFTRCGSTRADRRPACPTAR